MIDDLEQLIRATLSDDAQRAPQVDDLAARVAAAADASGRRQALAVTSLSAAAAIAAVTVSGTLAPVVGGAGATVIPGLASATSTSTAPAPSTAPGTYRGVIPTTPPEAQAPKPSPPPPTPLTGAALRNAREQETFGAQATRLQTFLDTHDATNFATMQMLRDPLRLRVLWKGAVPTQLREFAMTLPSDVPVVFTSVAYSTADWEAASKALFAAYGYDRRKPKAWSVNGTSAGDFSGIEVSVYKDQRDFPDPDMQDVMRVLAARSPMPISKITYTKGTLVFGGGAGTLVGVPPHKSTGTSSPTSAP